MNSKNDLNNPAPPEQRKVWGRRQSRPLNITRAKAMEEIFPQIEIDKATLTQDHALSTTALFGNDNETWMEIGFGSGEHVIGLLDQSPKINMVAAEPFLNGMAAFVKDLPKSHIPRTRVLMDDAMMLASSLQENSINKLYILNPDPWHKKRHYKRRIVSSDNLDVFAKILKSGGELIMTSDVPDLADWMITHAFNHPDFTWQATSQADWSEKPKNWITTRYETKGAKGAKKMCYLLFTRK